MMTRHRRAPWMGIERKRAAAGSREATSRGKLRRMRNLANALATY